MLMADCGCKRWALSRGLRAGVPDALPSRWKVGGGGELAVNPNAAVISATVARLRWAYA